MEPVLPPEFRELEHDEMEAMLRAHRVGRIGYLSGGHVDIQPIGYVYGDGAIHLRTTEGTKVDALRRSPWVAFEVDEVRGPYDWRSVVARGTVYPLTPDGTPVQKATYERAVELIRTADPAALTADDQAPWRDLLLRFVVDRMSGREATTGAHVAR